MSYDKPGIVHLPALLNDEFGIARSVARAHIAAGTVLIDGERWEGDPMDLPVTAIDGKMITVLGTDRHFQLPFDAEKRDNYFIR